MCCAGPGASRYYASGAFGTDRYPPFSLGAEPDYPATLDIAYPEHLSRGLVLVKWWLLAIPHYLVLGFLLGGGGYLATRNGAGSSGGLIGLLALFAVDRPAVHRPLPEGPVRPGARPGPVGAAGRGLRRADDRRLPAVPLDLGGADPATLVVDGQAPEQVPAPVTAPVPPRWTAGRVVALVIGSVLVLGGLGALGSATALAAADTHGRDAAGFVATPAQRFTGEGYALVADPLRLRQAAGDADLPGVVGEVRIRATATSPSGVFVGIGPTAAVQTYLAPVAHSPLAPPSTAQPSTPACRPRAVRPPRRPGRSRSGSRARRAPVRRTWCGRPPRVTGPSS